MGTDCKLAPAVHVYCPPTAQMAALINKTRLCHALNVLGFIGFSLQLTGMCIFQAREGGEIQSGFVSPNVFS